jgi:hypothetical protein
MVLRRLRIVGGVVAIEPSVAGRGVWRLDVSAGLAVAGAACRDAGEDGVGERGQGFDDGEVGEGVDADGGERGEGALRLLVVLDGLLVLGRFWHSRSPAVFRWSVRPGCVLAHAVGPLCVGTPF